MIIDLKNLPSEASVLQQIIVTLNAENRSLLTEVQSLKDQLALLKAKRFGKSSEKLDKKDKKFDEKLERQIAELEFRIEENESENTETTSDKQRPKRQKLPDHLPRIDVVLNPEAQCPECGGESFRRIADDISETLDFIPSSFKVVRHIRPRCACNACEKIVQAYAPSKAIDKGKAGAGLLSHILVQKYCNHLPFYRQSQIYEREGIDLARSTMAGWAGQCARLLKPLVDEINKSIFSSDQIHGDDTPVKVLAPGHGKTKTGRIWSYVRDGRPYGDSTPPAACYFYSPDRKGERPKEHLKDFAGTLHADAYAGYDQLYISEKNPNSTIEEAACWAHTRRKFYEITVTNDKASIAIAVLDKIGKIYEIEERIRGLDPRERLEHRKRESKILVEKLFISFRKSYDKLPPKSTTAKAIMYALNNQTALMRFLDNGKIEIDNNAAERSMRTIALGRKNWLFAGSDYGGDTAACMYSIIETAKLNNINPWKYLKKVLEVIQDHNHKKIADLLPWNLKLT